MSNRLFEAIRSIAGRGLSQSEVDRINAALDGVDMPEPARVPASEWQSLAEPLVKQFEGIHRVRPDGKVQAYPDPGTGGAPWTIGWGSTGPDIKQGTVWTRDQCDEQFSKHLAHFANGVEAALGSSPSTASQFAAMVSLAYNIGLGAFRKSTLLKRHKAGKYDAAAREFLRWNRAGGKVMRGLTRRREAEAGLYRA